MKNRRNEQAKTAFNAHLEDATRIAAELLVVLTHRVGWSDSEVDWTKVKPMMDILSQLEQVQQTVEAATGNRRPPLPRDKTSRDARDLADQINLGENTLIEELPPVSQRWFSQPTREDS